MKREVETLTDASDSMLKKWTGMVAPTMAILTGLLFLSGYIYRITIASILGVSQNFIDNPFQEVLVDGYISLLLLMIPFALVIINSFLTTGLLKITINLIKFGTLRFKFGITSSFKWKFSKILDYFGMLNIIIFVLTTGLAALSLGALVTMGNTYWQLKHCTQYCFTYAIGSKKFVGVPMTGDGENLVVYQQTGIVILKISEISEIHPGTEKFLMTNDAVRVVGPLVHFSNPNL